MKKLVSLILACGLLCATLVAVTGCSDNAGGSGSSSKENKYQTVFEWIKDCDVESKGASMRILQTDFQIKNWLKDNAALVSASNLVSGSDAADELSQYVAKMKDNDKAEFGAKCQAVIDADQKITANMSEKQAKAWGADVQKYSLSNVTASNAFFDALQNALVAENIKPSVEFPYIEDQEDGKFDRAYLLDLMTTISTIETATAGSTYQLDLDTADFMQFVIDNVGFDEKEIRSGVEECYNKLDLCSRLTFDWNFTNVLTNVDELLSDPYIITDMGKSVAVESFSKDDQAKLVKIVSDVTGVTYQ